MKWTPPEKVYEKLNSVGPGFCLAKWTQVTIHLGSGINHSCHHVKAHTIPKDQVLDNPNLLHNSDFKKHRRQEMKDGKRPSECDYCWRIEDNTDKFSDRVWKSRQPWSWEYYHKIKNSHPMDDFYPRYVEVSFSNVCNFKCSYCGPAFSSKWAEEIKEHGEYKFSTINWRYNMIDEYQRQIPEREENPYIEAFWKWFPEAVKYMHHFRITGGEPLLSKHTNRIIDYLIENPQPNLKFAINTNACPPKKLWPQFIKKIKYLKENNCIQKFTLFVSAEGKGAQQEYSRYGMDWQLFVKNVNQYLKEVDEDIIFMCAFNIFSFPTFLPFLKWISQLKAKHGERKVIISIPFVRNPGFLDAKIATPSMLAEYIIPCLNFMKMKNFDEKEILDLERIIQDLQNKFDDVDAQKLAIETRRMFYEYVEQYDKRRKTSFVETFPELKWFYKECKACMI